MPELGHARRMGRAQVVGPDDGDVQRHVVQPGTAACHRGLQTAEGRVRFVGSEHRTPSLTPPDSLRTTFRGSDSATSPSAGDTPVTSIRARTDRPLLRGRWATALLAVTIVVSGLTATPAHAVDQTVTLVGDLQSELGCAGDWVPACAATHLDASNGTWSRNQTGFDPTDKGFYHGGDLKGLTDKLDYIKGLGTTAIWMTPAFKNRPVQGTGTDASAGYHGYWITDFTQIDPHLGTNDDMLQLIAKAHAK